MIVGPTNPKQMSIKPNNGNPDATTENFSKIPFVNVSNESGTTHNQTNQF